MHPFPPSRPPPPCFVFALVRFVSCPGWLRLLVVPGACLRSWCCVLVPVLGLFCRASFRVGLPVLLGWFGCVLACVGAFACFVVSSSVSAGSWPGVRLRLFLPRSPGFRVPGRGFVVCVCVCLLVWSPMLGYDTVTFSSCLVGASAVLSACPARQFPTWWDAAWRT